jgi:hypothetical protein
MTAKGMTVAHNDEETQFRARRRRYGRVFGGIVVASMVLGGVVGVRVGIALARETPITTALSPAMAIAAIALFYLVVVIGSWRYFLVMDELELDANKWAGAIGLNFYLLAVPGWFVLSLAGLIERPPLVGWIIYALTIVIAMATFFWRKFR